MTNGSTIPIGDPQRLAMYAEVEAMVGEHGAVDFVVPATCSPKLAGAQRLNKGPVFGSVKPVGEDRYHVRTLGGTACETIEPVRLGAVGVSVDVGLDHFGWCIVDARFEPAQPEGAVDREWVVYFVKDASGPIKIGKAIGGVEARLSALQTGNPRALSLLATTTAHTEGALHKRFAAERITGEWFEPSARLLAFIEGLR